MVFHPVTFVWFFNHPNQEEEKNLSGFSDPFRRILRILSSVRGLLQNPWTQQHGAGLSMAFYYEQEFLEIGRKTKAGLGWFAMYSAGWKERKMFLRGETITMHCA